MWSFVGFCQRYAQCTRALADHGAPHPAGIPMNKQ